MVCRSGGMTAELAAVGMPSVLVPLPGAPGRPPDPQRRGVRTVGGRGDGRPTASSTGRASRAELDALLGDAPQLRAMEQNARALGRTDATARFADLVEEVARDAALTPTSAARFATATLEEVARDAAADPDLSARFATATLEEVARDAR